MKYFLRVLVVLVVAVGVVVGVYHYTSGNAGADTVPSANLTTVTKAPATEKNSNKVLLAELKDDGFSLYKTNNGVLLVHGDNETTFENWSSMIDVEAPQMYYANFDADDDKELIIRAVSGVDDTSKQYIYDLYVLNIVKGSDGKEAYKVTLASRSTWSNILDEDITEEVSQLKSCKKTIQVSMIAGQKTIAYNKTTGIATNGYAGYARALQKENGEYCTIDKWSKGIGNYYINSKNHICIKIGVNIEYKDTDEVQQAGYIYFELSLDKNNSFYVTERSMVFEANDQYKISDPREVAEKSWSYTENNQSAGSQSDKIIDWISYSPEFDSSITTQTLSYASQTNDIKNADKVKITDSYLEITSKSGYEFAQNNIDNGSYSVIINEGKDNEFDISYTASIRASGNKQILKITFDKSYPKSEIKTVKINFGSK